MSTDYIDGRQSYAAGRDPPSPISTPHEDWAPPRRKGRESLYDEERENSRNISPLDPRRITPTLHASLVSEILNLRRQLENKDEFIDHLENTLQTTKSDNELLEVRLAAVIRDVKTEQRETEKVQSHFESIADGLVRERDSAVTSNQELREKLDLVTRKSKDQEQDFAIWQQDWEEERQKWDNERRQLERRVLVTEDRLRVVVDEISSRHVAHSEQDIKSAGDVQLDDAFKDSGFGHDSEIASIRSSGTHKHHRTRSDMSFRSNPRSISSPSKRGQGFSLADELDLEEEDDNDLDESDDQRDEYLLHRRRTQLADLDAKAKKILGFEATTDGSASHVKKDSDDRNPFLAEHDERRDSKALSKMADFADAIRQQAEAMVTQILQGRSERAVSTETQTTPEDKPIHNSAQTQTDEYSSRDSIADYATISRPAHFSLDIPSIAIHPPLTAPSSPKPSVLPPATRNAMCQTDRTPVLVASRKDTKTANTGVQTEEIRVDTRRFVPATTASSDDGPSRMHNERRGEHTPIVQEFVGIQPRKPDFLRFQTAPPDLNKASKNFRSLRLKAMDLPKPVLLPSPAQLDQEATLHAQPLRRDQSNERKNSRSVSPMSFHEDPTHSESDVSDVENHMSPSEDIFGARPLVGRRGTSLKSPSFPMTVPEDSEASPHRDWRPVAPRTSSRDWKTKIGHGKIVTTDRSQHSRTPSGETLASSIFSTSSQPPPLPIPTRSSSKMHTDTFADGRSTSSRGEESPTVRRIDRQSSVRRPPVGVRKVQSASAMRVHKNSPPKRRRNAPTLPPIRSSVYENVGQTQFLLPDNLPAAPKLSTPTTQMEHSIASSTIRDEQDAEEEQADTTLVDAVASTMVGGWMWKYVGKRPSFGASESALDDNSAKSGGTRHKRWVWLSPYERTIMWSTKQPTTGAALMGKTGRKLQIKSILDVKDNNAPPKGETTDTVFDRSIMVLTPTRALKLTAPSRERHYHWLMALSFLANPSDMPPQVPRVPEAEIKSSGVNAAQQPTLNPVIEKSINKAQVRNFSEPIRAPSAKASLTRMVAMDTAGSHSQSSRLDSFDLPPMRPLESFNRHARKRSNTGPPRFAPSVSSSRSIASIVSPSLSATRFPRSRQGSFAVPPTNETISHDSVVNSPRIGITAEEAPGTVRMAAFVDNAYRDGVLYVPALPPAHASARPSSADRSFPMRPITRSRHNSQLSTTTLENRRSGLVFDDQEGRDLFSGF